MTSRTSAPVYIFVCSIEPPYPCEDLSYRIHSNVRGNETFDSMRLHDNIHCNYVMMLFHGLMQTRIIERNSIFSKLSRNRYIFEFLFSIRLLKSNLTQYIFCPFVLNLGNDLDSIRALFSEKEKELSLAVAKVEALTKQLEELRRDRRGPLNLISTAAGAVLNPTNAAATINSLNINGCNNGTNNIQQHLNSTSPAARELDKLRRELMVRKPIHDNHFFSFLFLLFICLSYQVYFKFFYSFYHEITNSTETLNRLLALKL